MGRLAFGGGIRHTELHVWSLCPNPEISHVARADMQVLPYFGQLSKPFKRQNVFHPMILWITRNSAWNPQLGVTHALNRGLGDSRAGTLVITRSFSCKPIPSALASFFRGQEVHICVRHHTHHITQAWVISHKAADKGEATQSRALGERGPLTHPRVHFISTRASQR